MKFALNQEKTRDLLAKADSGPWSIVPFFFHDRGSLIQKTIAGLLQEFLYGLIDTNNELLKAIPARLMHRLQRRSNLTTQDSRMANRELLDEGTKRGRGSVSIAETWSVDDLQEALLAIVQQNKVALNALIFIDALDEHEGNHRDLVKVIRSLYSPEFVGKVNIKFCLASRPEPTFANAFEDYPGFVIHEHTKVDVQCYVQEQIAASISPRYINQDMSEIDQLTSEITQKANGVFIWVRIVMDELIERFIDGSTILQLRNVLSTMPEELKDLYYRAVSKTKAEYALESYVMIQLILCAKVPLSLTDLLAAIDIALYGKPEVMSSTSMHRRLGSRSAGLLETAGSLFGKL